MGYIGAGTQRIGPWREATSMTMQIVVKNEDQGRTAEVKVEEFEIGHVTPHREERHEIGPGGQASFWIHARKRLVITENPNAALARVGTKP